MGWKDLLAPVDETVVCPWTGGREVRSGGRTFAAEGKMPPEHGWHSFKVTAPRKVRWQGATESPDLDVLLVSKKVTRGYLVADRLVPDGAAVVLDPSFIIEQTEPVYLVEPGLDRFVRVRASRWDDGRLIYAGQEFPLGPEGEVTDAFLEQKDSVTSIKGVTPALDLAFRFETWQRKERVRLREEAERLAREEAARLELEERRNTLAKQLGTGEGRRQMALVDFEAGARAALRVGGAELLDWRDSFVAGEAVVQFRYLNRKFECVCQKQTLRIVDAGVCLTDHDSGVRGDTFYTLESLPAVIAEANRTHRLVVFRHVDERGGYVRDGGRFHNEAGDVFGPDDEDEDY